jgi:hypothetical protein
MSVIELEMGPAREPLKCNCCGTVIESTHGFIYRDDEPFAVYQASWCEGHFEDQVNARIEIGGDWGNPATRPNHAFFGVLIFRTPEETGFSMLQPEESQWCEPEIAAEFLSRSAALAHPLKSEIFHIAEHIARDDHRIKTFLKEHSIDA